MVRNSVKMLAASLVMTGMFAAPAVSLAQDSLARQCDSEHRTVREQRRVSSRTYRPAAARASTVEYVEREEERTKTKTALMIAGAAATGAGVGGAMKGKKGAIIGAAVGGGAASIYEAVKRR